MTDYVGKHVLRHHNVEVSSVVSKSRNSWDSRTRKRFTFEYSEGWNGLLTTWPEQNSVNYYSSEAFGARYTHSSANG